MFRMNSIPKTLRGAGSAQERRCTGCAGRFLLLGNCSCVALISDIHVTMQNLHFRQGLPRDCKECLGCPWRSYARGASFAQERRCLWFIGWLIAGLTNMSM